MSFGSKHVFSGANFTIERGDKIALVGRNGEGKTTLARMIVGQLTPTEGSIRVGANVNIGYYAQNQEDLMNGDFTVYDTLDRVAVGDVRTRLRDILGAFLFRGEDIDKKVKVLSGGERARLAMARLMLEPYNLLILDEPTNHMDMRSKDILKNAIMKYDGTVIVVSHDREFLDGMVSKVYEFRNGGVREYLGGIYYFLEKRKLESLQEVERKDAPAKETAPKASSSGKLTYEQRKSRKTPAQAPQGRSKRIEASLADLEKKIADYDRKFAEATQYNEADYKAYNELKPNTTTRCTNGRRRRTNWKSPKESNDRSRKKANSTMKALILNGSPRPQGVVVQALRTAADTLRQAGADIEWTTLTGWNSVPCTGLYAVPHDEHRPLPRDAAHAVGEQIRQADLLVVGTPTYWGGMSARLKMLFERLVPIFMGESALGFPQPRQKGKRALVIAACTTPWPFNILARQSRGAVRSVREILGTGGMKVRTCEIPGTRKMNGKLPEKEARRIIARTRRIVRKIE